MVGLPPAAYQMRSQRGGSCGQGCARAHSRPEGGPPSPSINYGSPSRVAPARCHECHAACRAHGSRIRERTRAPISCSCTSCLIRPLQTEKLARPVFVPPPTSWSVGMSLQTCGRRWQSNQNNIAVVMMQELPKFRGCESNEVQWAVCNLLCKIASPGIPMNLDPDTQGTLLESV